MLNKVKPWHHAVVGLAIVVMVVLAGSRVVGGGDDSLLRAERFDAKQVTIWPDGGDAVRIREVVDVDFGPSSRRGYERILPLDFGTPQDVTASSPDANSDVDVVLVGSDARIRVGDPDITFTGRHRYVLEYVLPEARVGTGDFAIGVISNDETFQTTRFEVVLAGFDFTDTTCDAGPAGSFGGCDLERNDDGNLVTVIEPLDPGESIIVGGQIASIGEPTLPQLPELPAPVPGGFSLLGVAMIPLGLAGAALAYAWSRNRGSNEVMGAGGAADAAFGDLPVPGPGRLDADVPTYRVPDSRLAELATIEFVPPRGLDPWQGSALLREHVDGDTVIAWFSEMIATEALVLTEADGDITLTPGPNRARLSAVDQAHVARLFESNDALDLGSYDKDFAATWKLVAQEQSSFVRDCGWWSRGGPGVGAGVGAGFVLAILLVFLLAALNIGGALSPVRIGVITSPWLAVLLGFMVPSVVALFAYRALLPSRTATGSALTLRTESFRRFLAASEGKHVDWAWERGVLREYSAWAVALGAAGAWTSAIESSNIVERDVALAGPLLLHTWGPTFAGAHVAPSASGGGGGFSSGFSGGGGGFSGGSSGSW
jgi:uncharacterized membrane protein YgcG